MSVHAAQADGAAAAALDEVDEALVDLARQHHLRRLDRLAVGDAQAADKLRLLAEAGEQLGDLRAAAVHQHDLHADQV